MPRFLLVAICLLGCGEVRRNQQTFATNCAGGINQQFEKATFDQCADARNVWAPNGKLEARPGYVGVGFVNSDSTTSATFYGRTEDTSAGTFANPVANVLTLSNLVGRVTSGGDQDRWYLGAADPFDGVEVDSSGAPNSNATRFKAEYWDGTAWTYLAVHEQDGDAGHLNDSVGFFFARPQDWATTSVNSQSAYWIRFNLLYANIDLACTIDLTAINLIDETTLRGLFAAQYPDSKAYYAATLSDTNALRIVESTSSNFVGTSDSFSTIVGLGEPATFAVVPQFQEAYTAYNYGVVRHSLSAFGAPAVATVEDRAIFIGSGAPQATDYLAQLSSWPHSKYIQFFGGRLWAANLKDNPFAVRWSAAAGLETSYKVWPQLSIEVLAEHDNSPITGMHPIGEYMVIFKSDSIWMAYPGEIDAFGTQTFAIRQVVAGTGCVSNSSIRAIRGNLIFLAEDGIYRFDGANVEKLSDPLNDTIASITPGRRPFSAAAHWRSKSLYLLAVTTDGSTANNLVIVYDYKNGTWWLWDNIDAQHWLEDEAPNDNEELYFGDSSGRLYQMGVGHTDHGGTIDSYVTTQRLGYGSGTKQRLRSIEAWCSNKTREVDIDVYRNDETVTAGASGTIDFTDSNEPDWDDFNYSHAYGSITPVAGASLVDGETFTLNDGTNTASVFEFDSNGSVTGGRVTVTFTGGDSASTVRDSIVSAINGASNLNITATAGPGDYVRLDHDSNTTSGNQTITETVANSGFVVSGMTGAQGSDKDNWSPLRRRVRRIDTREDFDWVQAKISHDQKNQKFELGRLALNTIPLGNR